MHCPQCKLRKNEGVKEERTRREEDEGEGMRESGDEKGVNHATQGKH